MMKKDIRKTIENITLKADLSSAFLKIRIDHKIQEIEISLTEISNKKLKKY